MRKFLFGILVLIVVSFGVVGYTSMEPTPNVATENQTESFE